MLSANAISAPLDTSEALPTQSVSDGGRSDAYANAYRLRVETLPSSE